MSFDMASDSGERDGIDCELGRLLWSVLWPVNCHMYFEKLPNSPYLNSRAGTIAARMGDAVVP